MTVSRFVTVPSPTPPFTMESALKKVRIAENSWNTREPAKIVLAYSIDTRWRSRAEFLVGRVAAEAFLQRKWAKEFEYRLIKELWGFRDNRMAVRFAYEYRDDSNNWFRAYGNENWEFAQDGLMAHRHTSINEQPINETDRRFRWPLGPRPDDHQGLTDFGF